MSFASFGLDSAIQRPGLPPLVLCLNFSRHTRLNGARAPLLRVCGGGSVPAGRRSPAYPVLLPSPDKTLPDTEVADARRRIVRRLEHEVGAELRGA